MTTAGTPTPTATPTAAPTVMERLRDSTSTHHAQAEKHPFQGAQISGRLPREQYAANLGQLMLVHRALEAHLRDLRRQRPALAPVVRDHQFLTGALASDLKFFGIDPDRVAPTPATGRFVNELQAMRVASPLAILGVLYVLEGSTNGGKYIAKGVRRAYGLTTEDGTRGLDPYGERQREYWDEFKRAMNALEFSEPEIVAMIGAAQKTFDTISAIGSDVLGSHPA